MPFVLAVICMVGGETQALADPAGASPREIMERFARRASYLVPQVVNAIEQPLYPYFVYLAWVVAGIVAVFSFLRMMRHNEGATSDTVWWFTRFAICLAFLLGTNEILSFMAGLGHHIAYGEDQTSFLATLVTEQQDSFDESYRKFLENQFVVHAEGVNWVFNGKSYDWLAVLDTDEKKLEDIIHDIDPQSHDFALLFNSLSIARTLMEGADLFLIIVSYVLIFALRMSAPFMVALAVDRQIAGRLFNNYVWGAIVLTLVLPIVSQVMRIIVYAFGNAGMALGDSAPLYRWDSATLSVITEGNAWYTISLASLVMLVGALAMFASPYISYKLAVGQVFESVSQVTAGWMAAIASTGVELFSSAGAAALNRQAETTVAQGQAESGRVEAGANRDAQVQRVDGQAIMSKAGNNAAAFTAAASAMADGRMAATMAYNNRNAANGMLTVLAARETGENNVNTTAGVTHRRIENAQTSQNAALAVSNEAGDMKAGFAKSVPLGGGGAVGIQRGGAGASIGVGGDISGAVATSVGGGTHIENIRRGAEVADRATTNHVHVDQGANEKRNTIIAASASELQSINDRRAEADAGAAMTAAHAKAGAAWGGAGVANAGVETWRGMAVDAERIAFDGRIQAVDINLDAAKEAAGLRARAAVLGQLGRSVAQRVDEMGDQLRY